MKHSLHAGFVTVLLVTLWIGAALAAPMRIVSTNLCTDEYLFRLVPKDHIAALTVLAGDTHPQVSTIAGRVQGITLIRPNAEEVLMQHPDLVLLYSGVNARLASQLKAAGVAVFVVPWADSLAGIRQVTTMLGARLGAKAQAAALLAQMDDDLAMARRQAAQPPVPALLYEPNGYAASGPLVGTLMRAAGLDNIGPLLTPTRTGAIPLEEVIAKAPALLILDGGGSGGLADMPLHHPALAALKGHTEIVHAQLRPLLCAGPWSAKVALDFAHLGALAPARAGQ